MLFYITRGSLNHIFPILRSIIDDENKPTKKSSDTRDIPTPEQIVAKLSEYVIGQQGPKEVLAVAAYQHYKRIASQAKKGTDVEVLKSNVLLIGPTGCGKTYIVETLARIMNVPFAKEDLTGVTGAGWVGRDVTDVLKKLLDNADGDVSRAENGVVVFDEVDKLGKHEGPGTSQGFGANVQNALLTIIEGTEVEISVGKSPMDKATIMLDTTHILFVCAGAFDGLEKIIAKKQPNTIGSIGFGAKIVGSAGVSKALFHDVATDDLVKFGFDAQFVGRLPVRATFDELNAEMLATILTEPKNSLFKQFAEKLAWDGVESRYDQDAAIEIAKKAIKQNSGARGLRTICEKIYHQIFLTLPSLQWGGRRVVAVHLRAEHVLNGTPPELIYESPQPTPPMLALPAPTVDGTVTKTKPTPKGRTRRKPK
ncbi:MAG: ATP-dependent Clp protease ATP-binding subunit ClpX [Parcubacteria group bacterium GW2011_GWA2_47_8]|nr:MAG: ATP-dependent Clp protease ATP-binding subunit ClpX [Parcubacteria group bacterium GW2011_GWA2_47_8]